MHDIVQKRTFLGEMQGLTKLVRQSNGLKIVLFLPLILSEFLHPDSIYSTLLAAFLFCLAASAVYIVNDLKDIEKIVYIQKKSKKRPLASDQVSPQSAIHFTHITLYCAY